MKNICRLLFALILNYSATTAVFAYNLKQVANKENFSNSSITTFCQDEKGVMWIGTVDGLNTYNGHEIIPYAPTSDDGYLTGNYLNKILYTNDNVYWIQNYHGLNQYNTKTKQIS